MVATKNSLRYSSRKLKGGYMFARIMGFVFVCTAALLPAIATASIIKKPPVKSTEISYKDLLCTEEHKALIHELISTMAETSLAGLYFKEVHLNAIGDRVNEVHPLKFLSVIIKDPYLKTCLGLIWDSSFKRGRFLEGLGGRLSREVEKGKLNAHLEPFSNDVGIPAENIRPYFDSQDWGSFVIFLIHS